MKKALSVFLMTAMAFGAFADEPVADVNIAEFSGNASVQWGVDLDTMKTGFSNDYEVNLKLNLLNNGSKSTTGDGVWGELVLKTDGDSFIGWRNGGDTDKMNDDAFGSNTGMDNDLSLKVFVDTAKIHIGPAYIGIKRGDTQTGELKMDAAIRSADDDQSKWLGNVGPDKYTQGIVLGMDTDIVKVDLDLRSYAVDKTVPSKDNTSNQGDDDVVIHEITHQYTDAYAAALEAELKGDGIGVEGLSVKAGASFNFAENFYPGNYAAWKQEFASLNEKGEPTGAQRVLGYSASVGYKLGLDDTFYIRPQVGFTGQTGFFKTEVGNETLNATSTSMDMAAGLLFGWGEIGMDQDAGVYYLDDDHAKKVSPGVGVVAHIPLPYSAKMTQGDRTLKSKEYNGIAARIMPSFYSGELVPGLTAAAYADIVIPKTGKNETERSGSSSSITTYKAGEDAKTPIAFTLGAQYAIPVGEMTITPKAGVRFANAAYVDYKSQGFFGEKDDGVFTEMGKQQELAADAKDRTKYGLKSDGNFMNLKLGVDVGGLIDNTTLSVIWQTENILNEIPYGDGKGDAARFGPKLGTLNFKAKIAL